MTQRANLLEVARAEGLDSLYWQEAPFGAAKAGDPGAYPDSPTPAQDLAWRTAFLGAPLLALVTAANSTVFLGPAGELAITSLPDAWCDQHGLPADYPGRKSIASKVLSAVDTWLLVFCWDLIRSILGRIPGLVTSAEEQAAEPLVDYRISAAADSMTLAQWTALNSQSGAYVSPWFNEQGKRRTTPLPVPVAPAPADPTVKDRADALSDANELAAPNTAAQASHPGWPNTSPSVLSLGRNEVHNQPPTFHLTGRVRTASGVSRINWTNQDAGDGTICGGIGEIDATFLPRIIVLVDAAGLHVAANTDALATLVLMPIPLGSAPPTTWQAQGPAGFLIGPDGKVRVPA
jgi:hypothetical protein